MGDVRGRGGGVFSELLTRGAEYLITRNDFEDVSSRKADQDVYALRSPKENMPLS